MSERASPTRSRLWDVNDVIAYLGVKKSWIYDKAEAGLLPVIRYPGSSLLRFDPVLIEAFALGKWKPATVTEMRRAG